MFLSAFLSSFLVCLYVLIFYISATSPISEASTVETLEVLGFSVAISLLCALFIYPLFFLTKKLSRLTGFQQFDAEKFFIVFILFPGFLLLIENWSYSLFEVGLKTNDSIPIKFLFVLLALFFALQFSDGIKALSAQLAKRKPLTITIIGVICVLTISSNISKGFDADAIVVSDTSKPQNFFNIIILSSDGINGREMSVYRSDRNTTPFLKAKQSEFLRFNNAFSNNQNTTGSVVSLLTGMLPLKTKVVYPPDILKDINSVRSLPKILGAQGYYRSLWAVPYYADADAQNIVGAFDVNNGRELSLLDKVTNSIRLYGLQRWYFMNTVNALAGVTADVFFVEELDNPFTQVEERLKKQVEESSGLSDEKRLNMILRDIEARDRPFFIFAHFMGSHGPKFKPKNKVFSTDIEQVESWSNEYYHDAILDFDDAIQAVYRKLEAEKQLENTILVITSDHGQKYVNKNQVPLLFRFPNKSITGRYSVNVQLVDIAPTILAALNLPTRSWMDGESLLNPQAVAKDRQIIITGKVESKSLIPGLWAREELDNSAFEASNWYSVVRCNTYMRSRYPLHFTDLEVLPSIDAELCGDEFMNAHISQASEFIETKLRQ